MFNPEAAQSLRSSLPEFAVGSACRASVQAAEPLAGYMEHYGFFELLKNFSGDYYLGAMNVALAGAPTRVAVHYWATPGARGAVYLQHGLFDHAGLYLNMVGYFLEHGYSVLMLDLPGHGLSEGPPTAIDSFFDYADVATQVLQNAPEEFARLPLFGVGQSTGAAVLMARCFNCVKEGAPIPFERMVFLGPLIQPRRWRLGRLTLKLFGRFLTSVHRDMSIQNSHDEEFVNFLRFHDPLQARRLDVRWVRALDEWVRFCATAPEVSTPVLMVQGTADRVVDWRHNVPRLEQMFSCHQVNYIEGAMHHLVNESPRYRSVAFAGIGQFLKQRAVCKL